MLSRIAEILRTLLFGGSSLDDSEDIARRGQVERRASPAEVVRALSPQTSSFWLYRPSIGVTSDDPTEFRCSGDTTGARRIVRVANKGEVAAVLSQPRWRTPKLEPVRRLYTTTSMPMPPHASPCQQPGATVRTLPRRNTIMEALPFDAIRTGRVEDGLRTAIESIDSVMRDPRYRGGTFELGLPDVSPWQYMGPLQSHPEPSSSGYVSAPLPDAVPMPEAPAANALPEAATQASNVAGELVPQRVVMPVVAAACPPEQGVAVKTPPPPARGYVPMFATPPQETPSGSLGQAIYSEAPAARTRSISAAPQLRVITSGRGYRPVVRSVMSLRSGDTVRFID